MRVHPSGVITDLDMMVSKDMICIVYIVNHKTLSSSPSVHIILL